MGFPRQDFGKHYTRGMGMRRTVLCNSALRWPLVPIALVIAGTGLTAVSIILPTRPAPMPLEVSGAVIDLGTVELWQPHAFPILIHNRSSTPVTLVGAEGGCSEEGCISFSFTAPLVFAPGEHREIEVTAKFVRAGLLEFHRSISTDQAAQPIIPIRLFGTVVDSKRSAL
jgi:hypothetical protein